MKEKTLKELTQDSIAQVSGAAKVDESKFYEPTVDNLIHEVRASILSKQQNIMKSWVSEFFPTYSTELQENDYCTIKIESPTPIIFPNQGEAFIYVGSKNGITPFRRIGMMGSIATDYAHPATKPSQKRVSYDFSNEGTGYTYIRVYGNVSIENILVKLIAFNPTQIPTFRRDTDIYPISGELIPELRLGVFNKLMQQMAQTPQDTIADGEDPLNAIYRAANAMKRNR